MKILFICKRRSHGYGVSYGLINSCIFIQHMLESKFHIESKVVVVDDNNSIDREVSLYQPTHVIIEAIWVVPEKFLTLAQLHPDVQWVVRIHSKAPFLSTEGIATSWIRDYLNLQDEDVAISVSVNNSDFTEDLQSVLGKKLLYLPNVYMPLKKHEHNHPKEGCDVLNIGCFGAARAFKNQYEQAIASIVFANRMDKELFFHMNSVQFEDQENSIMKNIQSLFEGTKHHLVLHDWTDHEDFIDLVRTMDLGVQTSYSESFNIVSADFVDNDIPVVVSPDISWMPVVYKADPNDTEDIVRKLVFAHNTRKFGAQKLAKRHLERYNEGAIKVWKSYVKGESGE